MDEPYDFKKGGLLCEICVGFSGQAVGVKEKAGQKSRVWAKFIGVTGFHILQC